MRLFGSALFAAAVILGGAGAASAAPIVFDFTPSAMGTMSLGDNHDYTVSGYTISASSGYYNASTNKVTLNGILVGNNRGSDEQGLGVCLGSTSNSSRNPGPCSTANLATNPEIDASSREVVQLNIQELLNGGFNYLALNADSATLTELLDVYGSPTSNSLGTLLASITSAQGDVQILQNGKYLNLVADYTGGGDVILHSLTADKVKTPEPASLAILGISLVGLGVTRRLRAKT
jgi:hypothetical protein